MTTLVDVPLLNVISIFVFLSDNCSTFTQIFLTIFEKNPFIIRGYYGFRAY